MTDNPPIHAGQVLTGSLFNEPMKVVTVSSRGSDAWTAGLVGVHSEKFRNAALMQHAFDPLTVHRALFSYDGPHVCAGRDMNNRKG